jgi:hypothetical protein
MILNVSVCNPAVLRIVQAKTFSADTDHPSFRQFYNALLISIIKSRYCGSTTSKTSLFEVVRLHPPASLPLAFSTMNGATFFVPSDANSALTRSARASLAVGWHDTRKKIAVGRSTAKLTPLISGPCTVPRIFYVRICLACEFIGSGERDYCKMPGGLGSRSGGLDLTNVTVWCGRTLGASQMQVQCTFALVAPGLRPKGLPSYSNGTGGWDTSPIRSDNNLLFTSLTPYMIQDRDLDAGPIVQAASCIALQCS